MAVRPAFAPILKLQHDQALVTGDATNPPAGAEPNVFGRRCDCGAGGAVQQPAGQTRQGFLKSRSLVGR